MLEALDPLLGAEVGLDEAPIALGKIVRELRPATTGALHLTCSDESEHECVETFQRLFARRYLPSLKYGEQAPFRCATLSGRYEWGAARLAENHFATPESAATFKLLIYKVNAHVSRGPDGTYGQAERYHATSFYCGAIRSLLDGAPGPTPEALREDFLSEGKDRLTAIINTFSPALQPLAAAAVHARLQARKVTLDIQDLSPHTPTLSLVLPCVTLNQPGRDSEILLGFYRIDRRDTSADEYVGLGDDPSEYRIREEASRLFLSDAASSVRRSARDHRSLIRRGWEEGRPDPPEALKEAARDRHLPGYAKSLLKAAVAALAAAAGVPTALLLFGEGLVGIHHTWRAHRLRRRAEEDGDTRKILHEFEQRIDALPSEKAHQVLNALLTEYGL